MHKIDDYLEQNRQRYEDELKEFLRIPSVSADSRHKPDVQRACQFVAEQIRQSGVETEIVQTDGHPLIVAEWLHAKDAPTLLIYGHYDVQPPDPLEKWITGPFEPTIRDGNIYARGATDDKGQMYTHVKAVEAWLKTHGHLPVNVKFLIEGEEEVGSDAVEQYLETHRDRLKADYVVISDSGMFAPDIPAITYGLKGLAYFEVILQGPARDLHSGTFGGSVQNPCNALAELIASLKDSDGKIRVPGFYDDVVEIDAREKEQIFGLGFDEEGYKREVGVDEVFGEKGYSTLERRWVRPTCDVNGLYGGYQGEGAKTVLPASAGVKVSFRLVPNQDPHKIEASFRKHLEDRCPPGVTMEIRTYSANEAVVVSLDSPGIRAATKALKAAFGREPVFIREGGSIPIVTSFKRQLGVDSLLLGYGLSDDNTHSPNEKFSLKDFHRGIKANAYLLQELANANK